MWSFTRPQACMPAYTVVGPRNRNPSFFSSLARAADSGVLAGMSDSDCGTGRPSGSGA